MQSCLKPLGWHSIEFSAVQCYLKGINEIGSCSMLVSDVIFCIILQWRKKELMFYGHDPEVRSFWKSLLIN